MSDKKTLINDEILAKSVRVINDSGGQLGIMGIKDALRQAENTGLDLVLVSPDASPPVCRIMDWGKAQYAAKKKAKAAKSKQTIIQIKEIQLRPTIDDHDLDRKINDAKKFLDKGNKVRFNMRFKGREMSHMDIGMDIMNQILENLNDFTIEKIPSNNGNSILMILSPT